LISGMVMLRRPLRSEGLDMDVTERALTGGLRLARSRAVAQNRDVVVVIGNSGFSVDGGLQWRLPDDEALTPARVLFTPDGESSGATINLTSMQKQLTVTVDWLTGRVRIQPVGTP